MAWTARTERTLARLTTTMLVAVVVIAGCGGDDDTESIDAGDASADDVATDPSGAEEAGDGGPSAEVVDPPEAGQARAEVDATVFTFPMLGPTPCSISDDAISYAFTSDDGLVTLGGGLNRVDDGWMGSIALDLPDPDGGDGRVAYYPAPGEQGVLDGAYVAVDGNTAVYTGPMVFQPPNDGTQPPPVDIGTGTVVATC